MAALQIAKMIKAEIYATVRNEDEIKHLTENFAISESRIFNSSDSGFVDDIMQETGGHGVDLALNSLSGDLLHATWKCVAEFGKMIDISKGDMLGAGALDLGSFLGGRSYTGFHLDALVTSRPDIVRR